MSYAVGVDIPVSQMPAGMAFDSGGGGLLGSIGSGLLKGITGGLDNIFNDSGSSGSSGAGYSSPRSSYSNDTKRIMQAMLLESLRSFDPSRIKSTIGDV